MFKSSTVLASAFLLTVFACDQPLPQKPEPPQPPPTSTQSTLPAPALPGPPADVVAEESSPPATGRMCGGIAAIQCGAGEFCSYQLGMCRQPDASGTCERKPEMCAQIYAAVCGCDGKTYANPCIAQAAGVSIAATGECAGGGAQ